MPAARRTTSDLVSLATGGAVQLVVLVALAGTALAFWRALADPFQPLKLAVLVLAAVVALVLTALRRAGNGWLELPPRPVLVAAGLFTLGLAVAVATSPRPLASFMGAYGVDAGFLTYVAAMLLGLAAATAFHDDDEGAERFLGVTVAVAALMALYAVVQFVDLDPFTWLRATDVFATLGNADYASGWLGSALPLAAGWTWLQRDDPRRRLAGVGVTVLVGLAVLATGSFQGIPAAAVGLLVMGAILALPHRGAIGTWRRELPDRARTAVTAALAAAALAFVAVLAVLPQGISQGLLERKYFWRAALKVFGEHPVVGSGLDTFGNEFFSHRAAEHAVRYGGSSAQTPHSVPLAMLSGGGLVLAVAYLIVLVAVGVTLFRGVARLTGERRALGAALVGAWVAVQVQAFVSIDVPSLVALQWVVAGVGLAVVSPVEWRVRLGAPVAAANKRGRVPVERWRPLSPVLVAVLVVPALIVAWLALYPVRADKAVADAVHAAKGKGTDAVGVVLPKLNTATNLAPWVGTYELAKASYAQSLGNPGEAVKAAKRAAELEPGQPRYAQVVGDLYGSLGQKALAARWYVEAVSRDPNSPETLAAAARGMNDIGRPTAAARYARRALALDPARARGWFELGRAEVAAGDRQEGATSIEKAVGLDPSLKAAADAILGPAAGDHAQG